MTSTIPIIIHNTGIAGLYLRSAAPWPRQIVPRIRATLSDPQGRDTMFENNRNAPGTRDSNW